MRELAIKILEWLKSTDWSYYSEDVREDYIKDLMELLETLNDRKTTNN